MKLLQLFSCAAFLAAGAAPAFAAPVEGSQFTLNGVTYVVNTSTTAGVVTVDGALTQCTIPANVSTPEGDNLLVETIEAGAFKDSNVAAVTLPYSLTTIKTRAFENCPITAINIPASTYNIASCAFNNAPISKITIDRVNSCFRMEGGALYLNTQGRHFLFLYPRNKPTESYTVSAGCLGIMGGAFYNCDVKEVVLPATMQTIDASAFQNSTLEKINLPDNVFVIQDYSFAGTKLQNISLPNNIWSVPAGCFEDCANLSSVTLPESVGYIYNRAFANCSSLSEIVCKSEYPADFEDFTDETHPFCNVDRNKVTVFCPDGADMLNEYTSSTWGELFSNIHNISDRNTTGVLSVNNGEYEVIGGSALTINTKSAIRNLRVYSLSGQCMLSTPVAAGHTRFDMPAGLYVVSVNGSAHKVAIR